MSDSMKKLIDELCAALYELGEVADEAWLNGKQYWDAWEKVRHRWDAATASIAHAAEKMGLSTWVCRVKRETIWGIDVDVEVWIKLGCWSDSPPPPPKFRKLVKRLTRNISKLAKRLRASNAVCREAIPVLRGVAEAFTLGAVMGKLRE